MWRDVMVRIMVVWAMRWRSFKLLNDNGNILRSYFFREKNGKSIAWKKKMAARKRFSKQNRLTMTRRASFHRFRRAIYFQSRKVRKVVSCCDIFNISRQCELNSTLMRSNNSRPIEYAAERAAIALLQAMTTTPMHNCVLIVVNLYNYTIWMYCRMHAAIIHRNAYTLSNAARIDASWCVTLIES